MAHLKGTDSDGNNLYSRESEDDLRERRVAVWADEDGLHEVPGVSREVVALHWQIAEELPAATLTYGPAWKTWGSQGWHPQTLFVESDGELVTVTLRSDGRLDLGWASEPGCETDWVWRGLCVLLDGKIADAA